MGKAGEALVAIVTAAFTVAIIALLFSAKSQTPAVLQAGGTALSSIISAAMGNAASSSTGLNLPQVSTSNL